MTTLGRQYKPKRTFSNGVDNTTPIESEEISNTLSYCLNGEMVDSDIIKTRPGLVAVTAAKATYIIRQGIEYNNPDGSKEQIVYLESTTITGSSGILGRINGTSIDTITSGLPDGIKPTLIQAGALLFIFTGVSDLLYDGSVTRQIGIEAPISAPTFKSKVSGYLNDGGFYTYVYCYRNSATGAVSSPSYPSPTITSGTQLAHTNGIVIGIVAGNPLLADTIDVYRTASGGTLYFFDGSVPINSTTYTSTVTDQGLGTQLELDNSRLPEAATMAVLVDNRLFVAGFKSNKARIQYSKVGINGTMYESFQIADIVDCNLNDGEAITGLGAIGSKVGVIKEKKAGRLLPLDVSSGGLETGGGQKYIYREMSDPCTATNHHTIFSIEDAMGWLGRDNVYVTDGSNIKQVGNRIRNTIRSLNLSQSYKFSVFSYEYPHQLIFSVVQAGKTEPDYQLVAHTLNSPIIAWTMFGPGPNPTTHPGIPSGCMWEATINGAGVPYVGSSNGDGKVYEYGRGNNDYGNPIYFSVKDQWEPGPDAIGLKSFQSVKYLATTAAASPNNILNNTWEENGREYVVKTGTSTIIPATKWGSAKWGTFKWAGLAYTLASFFPNRKSHLGRFGFYNDKIDSPFAIKSMRILFRNISE